jgi:hypothetical protein
MIRKETTPGRPRLVSTIIRVLVTGSTILCQVQGEVHARTSVVTKQQPPQVPTRVKPASTIRKTTLTKLQASIKNPTNGPVWAGVDKSLVLHAPQVFGLSCEANSLAGLLNVYRLRAGLDAISERQVIRAMPADTRYPQVQ